jgi:hypothetical protein
MKGFGAMARDDDLAEKGCLSSEDLVNVFLN